MGFAGFATEDSIAAEYDRAAHHTYPKLSSAETPQKIIGYASDFGDVLGNQGEFRQYVEGVNGERAERVGRLFEIFHENVKLLVEKTWVEKSDEKRKEKLLRSLELFVAEFASAEYPKAQRTFVGITHDLAFLLFGDQCSKPDFVEYCFRIDPKLGLFFWYIDQVARDEPRKEELLRTELLLGVYFLSSF